MKTGWLEMKAASILLSVALLHLQPAATFGSDPGTGGGSFSAGIRMIFEAATGSLDLFDSTDGLATPSQGWNGGVYHVKGQDGWVGDTGFYARDFRSPLVLGESKTWTFYVWAVPGTPASSGGLAGGLWTSDLTNLNAVLEYIQKPAGITGGPVVGTAWTAPTAVNILLPFYSTSDGQAGHGFRLTLTAVPEPSGLLALAAASAGLLALARRRRG